MILISVDSTAIAAIGYDCGLLRVVFRCGGIYHHPGVPRWVFEEFLDADSPGTYYVYHICGRYP